MPATSSRVAPDRPSTLLPKVQFNEFGNHSRHSDTKENWGDVMMLSEIEEDVRPDKQANQKDG